MSIARGVDASHCRASVNVDMDDVLMTRWTRGKRAKPSTAQGCDLNQV